MSLISVQPFGLASPGGGPRILRSLYQKAPMPVLSVVTGRQGPGQTDWDEIHLPARPRLRPIDGTRYDHWGNAVEIAAPGRLKRSLVNVGQRNSAEVIHAVAHSAAFWPALQAARALDVPFVLTVHDDVRYLLRNTPRRHVVLERLSRAWRSADARLVISSALGEEYCRRYGAEDYAVVTDGLAEADFLSPRSETPGRIRCYFAGLFHRGYRPNLAALTQALRILREHDRDLTPSVTCRSGSLPAEFSDEPLLTTLPFGAEAEVRADISDADLLYLPLMFDSAYADMIAFSLSTKLVTYLGSGLPILYHGPAHGAAYDLLAANNAAILATTTEPQDLAAAIQSGMKQAEELVESARDLARREFLLEHQRERFWNAARPQRERLV